MKDAPSSSPATSDPANALTAVTAAGVTLASPAPPAAASNSAAPIISGEDIRKCGEEIKQLRNQQFILGNTALSLFGVYVALIPKIVPSPGEQHLDLFHWSGLTLLIVFLVMFLWARQLRVLISAISIWMELNAVSTWEQDYRRNKALHNRVPQLSFASSLFLILGVAMITLVSGVEAGQQVDRWKLIVFAVVDATYLLIVALYGFGTLRISEAEIKQEWEDAIAERKGGVPQTWNP